MNKVLNESYGINWMSKWQTDRAESRLPNYIVDVVLSYFPKFYSYIYSNCGALSQTILLITEAP